MQTHIKNKPIIRVVETPITDEEMKILISGKILLCKIPEELIIGIQTTIVIPFTVTSTWASECRAKAVTVGKKPSCNVKVSLNFKEK